MIKNKDLVIVVVVAFCLTATLFAILPVSSSGGPPYDPWWDITDDGKIDIADLARVSGAFGTYGQSIDKASIQYDSGWMNITDKQGQNITVTHNLNITDWNDPNMTVEITGKTTPDSGLQRFLGLTGQQGWNKTYGGTYDDEANSLIQTWDGGYAIAGSTKSSGAGDFDFWLVKTDASGNQLWNKTYGGTGEDWAFSLVQTGDGGYAIAGHTASFGAGSDDVWLVKTDANGNMQWNKTYGGTYRDRAFSLVRTGDGGYALAGYANGESGPSWGDFWLVRTDASGNMLWNKTYGGGNWDGANSVIQTGDGGYAIAGITNSFGANWPNAWLVRTDASGNMLWDKTYGGTDQDRAYSVIQTGDGGYAIAGVTKSFGAGGWDFWLVKTDASGNQLWNKTYGGTGEDWACSVVLTGDGGYAIAGATESFGAGGWDFWLVRTDASGNMQWNKTYGGGNWDWANSLIQTWDGGYAIAGITNSFGAGGPGDVWLVKTDASGSIGESGLISVGSTSDSITLYRGTADPYWNYVRVQIWKRR